MDLGSNKLLQSLRKSVQEAQKKAEKEATKPLPVQLSAQPGAPAPSILNPVSAVENKQRGEKTEMKKDTPEQKKMSEVEAKYQYTLGKLYSTGDHVKALECYLIAADHGIADAQYSIAEIYMYYSLTKNGEKIAPDYKAGALWYEKAALQNHTLAQFKTGWVYENGFGVNINKVKAAEWYRKAAEKNQPQAQFRLGYLYSKGYGVPKNEEESLKWIRKSAENGYKTAKNYLKVMRK